MMDNEKLEARIRRLAEHTAPEQLTGILEACEARKGNVITMNEVKKKKNRFLPLAVAAAIVLVCIGGYIGLHYGAAEPGAAIASVITLDVNPSLNIVMDTSDKVIEVQPLNEDARTVIGDMDFAGANLDVTVNALIGSMLVNGYLDDIRNSILVSVENGDAAKAESLQAQVSALISSAVGDGGFEASVLTQTVSSTSESAALAEQYGISEGKAELILKVCAADATLTAESLAPLSVNDISLIASSRGLSDSTVNQTGTASAKGYIGEAAAKEAALAHAGVSEADVCWLKADFDRDDGVYYYELEFAANGMKYDYEINALTGDVVKFEQEQTGNLAGNGSGNSGSGTGTGAGTGNQYGNGAGSVDTGSFIGEAAAKAAALSDAGVSESEVTRLKCELDRDHGSYKYEIEFNVGRTEYEYEVDAYSGAILKAEQDYDD